MKPKCFLSLTAMLCVLLFLSCSSGVESPPSPSKYCIYSETRECFQTSQATCPVGGELSDFCPYSSSSLVNSSSSSTTVIRSSSSVALSSSSVIFSSSSVVVQSSSSSSGGSVSSSSVAGVGSSSSVMGSSSSSVNGGKGNDITNYRTVQIGEQIWMAENLDYNVSGSQCYGEGETDGGSYQNGEWIPKPKYSPAEIKAYCDAYGRLYNWATAMALPASCNTRTCASQISTKHRGICPSGWHIPSDAEWTTLIKVVGADKSGTNLKSKNGWILGGNGTDYYGFSALPSGYGTSDGSFYGVGIECGWWSSFENAANNASNRSILFSYEYAIYNDFYNKSYLLSIRCIQD